MWFWVPDKTLDLILLERESHDLSLEIREGTIQTV